MPVSPDQPTPSLQPHSPGRRFLTRLASSLASKSRTITDFYVQAHDPHKRYSSGDIVQGSVVLKLSKPIRVTHIVLCLHGFVQVYKNPGAPPTDGFRSQNNLVGKGRGSTGGAEYFGNGFASLFEEEAVICGEGRVDQGNYKFEFEMRFPDDPMPSSIDFERGTISYMITATMTRPTSIAPITHHDQKIHYVERIDISKLLPPKPRTITLEPLVRRNQGKSQAKKRPSQVDALRQRTSGSGPPSLRSQPNPSSPVNARRAHSPSLSIGSVDSHQSSGGRTSVSGSLVQAPSAISDGSLNLGKDRTITVTVESLKGGCLRGDYVPIKIVVNHTKHIKSMQGLIATLYRQARVDTHPAIPIGPMSDSDKKKREDYYPKSLTGLGGLSLSGAGSSHVFRKDLAQIIMPLIIDPQTLTVELTPKLRVPEDSFPTTTLTPGSMITFNYYVEVMLDIQGKLAGQERLFGQSTASATSNEQYTAYGDTDDLTDGERYGQQRAVIVDTAPIRRDKTVVTCVLEVVVGTRDSERAKGKARTVDEANLQHSVRHPLATWGNPHAAVATPHSSTTVENVDNDLPEDHPRGEGQAFSRTVNDYRAPPAFMTNPDLTLTENVTEKERYRRAEASLMPSQPPGTEDGFPGWAQASAPDLYDDSDNLDISSRREWIDTEQSSAAMHHAVQDPYNHEPRAPDYGPSSRADVVNASEFDIAHTNDDKQDLLRSQLESQASVPPPALPPAGVHRSWEAAVRSQGPTGMDAHVPGVEDVNVPDLTAWIPDLDSEESLHDGRGQYESDHLPRYER